MALKSLNLLKSPDMCSRNNKKFRLILSLMCLLLYSSYCCSEQKKLPQKFGWHEIPETDLRSKCPPNGYGRSGYNFKFYCRSVTGAWGGGAFDTRRNRLYLWGGGHTDYFGNEIYALDLNALSMNRLTDPALPIADHTANKSEIYPFNGTQPNSRHTYDGVVYLENVDRLWAFSGSLAGNGGYDNTTWIFNPNNNRWRRMNPAADIPQGGYGIVSAYDYDTGKVFLHDRTGLFTYQYSRDGGVYARLNSDGDIGIHASGVIDPKRRKFIIIGNGHEYIYDIGPNSKFVREKLNSTGDIGIIKPQAPGFDYDPVSDRIVGWGGRKKIYSLNLDTREWTSVAFNNDPGPQFRQGTYGRWAYAPNLKVFVVYNGVDENAFIYRPLHNYVDTKSPTTPKNLAAKSVLPSKVLLSWDSSSDDVGVVGYRIYRDGKKISDTEKNSFAQLGLSGGISYEYSVMAFDSAGHTSEISDPANTTTPISNKKLPIGDCSAEDKLKSRKDIVFCEPWEKSKWWRNGYLGDPIIADPRPPDADWVSMTEIVSEPCMSGKCLKANMLKGKTRALSVYWPLIEADLAPEEIYLRYYIRLDPAWDPYMCDSSGNVVAAGGKFPGPADVRTWADPFGQCGNGGASGDGINCWSMRAAFHDCKSNDGNACASKPNAAMRFGSYLYHYDQREGTGSSGWWDNDDWGQRTGDGGTCDTTPSNLYCGIGDGGVFEKNRWYRVEMQVKMNTPGEADGIVRGWVNGAPSYNKTNMIFRVKGHDSLHNRLIWLNVYKGGTKGNCKDSAIYLDQMVVATDMPVGGLDDTTRIPPSLEFSASSIEVEKGAPITLKWTGSNVRTCRASGGWEGEKPSEGIEEITLYNKSVFNLDCEGENGPVSKTLRLITTGETDRNQPNKPKRAERKPNRLEYNDGFNGEKRKTQEGKAYNNIGNLPVIGEAIVAPHDKDPAQNTMVSPKDAGQLYTLTPEADSYLDIYSPKSFGIVDYMDVSKKRRMLLRFNLQIVKDKKINSAILRLYDRKRNNRIGYIGVFRANKDWAEGKHGATRKFYNQAATLAWEHPLGDWIDSSGVAQGGLPYVLARFKDEGIPGWIEWDVTNLVSEWVQGVYKNQGFLIRNLSSEKSDYRFSTREYAEKELRPILVVRTIGNDKL